MNNNNMLKVFDEMFEKLDNNDQELVNQSKDEFDENLKNKLDGMAVLNGYKDYESLINLKTINIKEIIDNIDYDTQRYSDEYINSHKEAINKYFKLLNEKGLYLTMQELMSEIQSSKLISVSQSKKGYKDGLNLFKIIIEDYLVEKSK